MNPDMGDDQLVRVGDLDGRDRIATRMRDWIHEQPFSICAKTNMDTCPDWDMAYKLADIALGKEPK